MPDRSLSLFHSVTENIVFQDKRDLALFHSVIETPVVDDRALSLFDSVILPPYQDLTYKSVKFNFNQAEQVNLSTVNLYYKVINNEFWGEDTYNNVVVGDAYEYTLDNLISNVEYEYYFTYDDSGLQTSPTRTFNTTVPPSMNVYDFENGQVPPEFTVDGTYGISIIDDTHENGTKVTKFNNTGIDGSVAYFEVPVTLSEISDISFDFYSSSEGNFDIFRAYLDGVEHLKISGDSTSSYLLSTNVDSIPGLTACAWKTYTFKNVSIGGHTLKFSYTKDGVSARGDDNAYIDNIVTPDGSVPILSNILPNQTDHAANLTFDIDEYAKAQIEYGLTTGYGTTIIDNAYYTNHAFILNMLNANTEYFYRITATDGAGNTEIYTNSFNTQAAITNGYEIERSTDGVNFVPLASVDYLTNSFDDVFNLQGGQVYHYRVKRITPTGESEWSNIDFDTF